MSTRSTSTDTADYKTSETPPLKFAIIGHNIAYSVSPAMHNAAYAELGLPHIYGLIDEESVDDIVSSGFWSDDAFRGMSVTIPHKQAIMGHLDVLSDAAQKNWRR